MKILVQYPSPPHQISGVRTYATTLGRAIDDTKGHEARVISSADMTGKSLWAAVADSDVVHANSNHLLLLVIARILRKPSILKVHYVFYQTTHASHEPMSLRRRLHVETRHLWNTYGFARLRIFIEALIRLYSRVLAVHVASTTIACSHALKRSMDMGDRVGVIYNPISVPIEPKPHSNSVMTFAFIGRVTHDKGADTVIDAAIALQHLPIRFVVIGDGELRVELEQRARVTNLSNVEFTGGLDHRSALERLAACDVHLMPGRWYDPAPYSPAEAALLGVPTIGTRIGGIPETAGPSALLVEPGDFESLCNAITYAADHRDDMRARADEAREYVSSTFGRDTTIPPLFNLVLSKGARKGQHDSTPSDSSMEQ